MRRGCSPQLENAEPAFDLIEPGAIYASVSVCGWHRGSSPRQRQLGLSSGFRIKKGTLDLSQVAIVSAGVIQVPATATCSLNVDLDPPHSSGTTAGPGADAGDAIAGLPARAMFVFTGPGWSGVQRLGRFGDDLRDDAAHATVHRGPALRAATETNPDPLVLCCVNDYT